MSNESHHSVSNTRYCKKVIIMPVWNLHQKPGDSSKKNDLRENIANHEVKLYVAGNSKSRYQLKNLVNMIEWYGVFSGITHVRLSIICTHLHSSVWRSQVQFVGLHSWGGSFLSQNIRASVTTLEFSSIGQRTIVTDQELQNHTHLPQNGNNIAIKHLFLNDGFLDLETRLIRLTQAPQVHHKYCLFHPYHWMSYLHHL